MLGGNVGEDGPEGLDGLLVADLYAGCGTSGVAMARAGADSAIAVESAASLGARNLRRNADGGLPSTSTSSAATRLASCPNWAALMRWWSIRRARALPTACRQTSPLPARGAWST